MSLYGLTDSTSTTIVNIVDTSIVPDVEPEADWILLDGMNPVPQIGWVLANGVWGPNAVQQAQQQAAQFYQAIPDHITQAQADAQAMAALQAGQPLTAAQVKAIQNHSNGWVTLLQALQALYQAIQP